MLIRAPMLGLQARVYLDGEEVLPEARGADVGSDAKAFLGSIMQSPHRLVRHCLHLTRLPFVRLHIFLGPTTVEPLLFCFSLILRV